MVAAPSDLADLSASADPLSSADASTFAVVSDLATSADPFVSAEVSAFAGAAELDVSDLSDFPASAEASGFDDLSALVDEPDLSDFSASAEVSVLPVVSVLADVSVLPGFAASVVASGFAEVSGLVVSPASGTGQLLNGSRNFESDAARALSGAAASEAEITRAD